MARPKIYLTEEDQRIARLNRQNRWRAKTPEKQRDYHRKYEATPKSRAKSLLQQARMRAKRFDRNFDITIEDIVIPTHCPVLGIEIDCGPKDRKWGSPNSPSLDRTNSDKGYVKGNVRVISWRANSLKKNGTADEFQMLADYLRTTES